jgi:hypothetical protein
MTLGSMIGFGRSAEGRLHVLDNAVFPALGSVDRERREDALVDHPVEVVDQSKAQ